MEKRATQHNNTRKSYPYKPNKLNLESTFTIVTNHKSQKPSKESHPETQAHQKEKKRKDSNFPKKIGLPPNKR